MKSLALAVFVLVVGTPDARADLVFLASGRSVSVRAVRDEGDRLVLVLRDGGEIACSPSLIVRIEPNEVPELEPPVPAAMDTSEAVVGADRELLVLDSPFAVLIERAAQRHGVDARLVRAVVQVESGYRPRARSRKGAKGLMQLMPDTARQYSVRNAFDPSANITAGVRHLRALLDRLPLELALAAYNAGEAAVARFQGIPPYPETRDYVARVLKLVNTQTDTH